MLVLALLRRTRPKRPTLLLSSPYFDSFEEGNFLIFADKPAIIGATEVPARLRRRELALARPGARGGPVLPARRRVSTAPYWG